MTNPNLEQKACREHAERLTKGCGPYELFHKPKDRCFILYNSNGSMVDGFFGEHEGMLAKDELNRAEGWG